MKSILVYLLAFALIMSCKKEDKCSDVALPPLNDLLVRYEDSVGKPLLGYRYKADSFLMAAKFIYCDLELKKQLI